MPITNNEVNIPEDLKDLIPQYMQRRDEDWVQIQKLHESKDWAALKKIAHTIKGSAASYGFIRLGDIALRMEKVAIAQDVAGMIPIVREFGEHLMEIKKYLG